MKGNEYERFLDSKASSYKAVGKSVNKDAVNPILFPFQRDITRWAVGMGRAAIWIDTGLGKTFIQLEWAKLLGHTTLIVAPLSVAKQTIREARKIGTTVKYCRGTNDVDDSCKIWITNYEMIDAFDFSQFRAIVLDESSILKAIGGVTKRKLIELTRGIDYRLCCTATPAPNDYIELGNHAEFLGVCSVREMMAMFFVNANKEHTFLLGDQTYQKKGSNSGGTEWRLKHHAERAFYHWLSGWAMSMTKPSDLGYSDEGYGLPPLNIVPIIVAGNYRASGELFFTKLHGLKDRHEVRRVSIEAKFKAMLPLISGEEQTIIWAGLNEEAEFILSRLNGEAIEVRGDNPPEDKARIFEEFQAGQHRILVTKVKIGGYGMNFQNANNMIFFGINDSWESYYQAIRRQWRFGQKRPVNVYLLLSRQEGEILHNLQRKDAMAVRLRKGLIEHTRENMMNQLEGTKTAMNGDYREGTFRMGNTTLMLGDACKRIAEIETASVDLSIYSPPFADLFVYSASDRDMGNCRDWEEFFGHYRFLIPEILRVTKAGRISCVHTSDIPAMANRDGFIGLKDFPGRVIEEHLKCGWLFVGRAFIQKNPQAQAIRVKSKALLFVQLNKDAACSRPALVDQMLIFKKPGKIERSITPVQNGELDNETWISWAHGIWTDINETDTLQYYSARDKDDEKHICPLQLGTIERCIKLYSNPGEIIFSPFMGIGSEIYMAVKLRRGAVGIELKPSYYDLALANVKSRLGQATLL